MLVHFLPDCLDSLAAEFCPSASPCDDDIWADWVIESIVLQIQSNCTTAAKWLSAGFKIGVLLSFEGVYTSSLYSNFPQECCAVPRLDKMLAHYETSNDGGKRGVLRRRRGKKTCRGAMRSQYSQRLVRLNFNLTNKTAPSYSLCDE